ncbi:MAG TPA: BrnA antitoxin family protein [Steroidobacteraceae bacterium]|jgi:uncharacterized protein (DUF4415 family)|nr:BrnA antitoxin family protein [Steroidobacteraceae bacterium]
MSKRATSKRSKTDWKRIDSMRDEDIDYSDIPPTTPEQFANAIVRYGLEDWEPKEQITLRIDADVLAWFRAQGKGYQTRINRLLRAYMEAHVGKKGARRA